MEVTYDVGKNAKHNWQLLDESNDNDIWIHVNDYPSSYVIIRSNDNIINKEHIKHGCYLCYNKTKNKLNNILNSKKRISFTYLECKYVKKGKITGEAILLRSPNIKSFKISELANEN